MKVYFGLFKSLDDVCREFNVNASELQDADIIYASYDQADYEGEAHVIFVKNGLIFEVNGSHCSCNGLEECWVPEETEAIALLKQPRVSKDAQNNIKEYYKNLMCFL